MAEQTDRTSTGQKACPFCAETIQAAAVKCRYCGSDLAGPEPVAGGRDRPPFLGSVRLLLGLLALCLLLSGVTAYAWYRGADPAAGDSSAGAITSTRSREAGLAAAATLTRRVLSYDWKTLDTDVEAAEKVMAPSFRAEYAKGMAGVKDQTVKNQVRLTATVVASSVVSASKDKVVALVFVNQVTAAKGAADERLDQNRVLVTLTRDDGEWRVSKMDAF